MLVLLVLDRKRELPGQKVRDAEATKQKTNEMREMLVLEEQTYLQTVKGRPEERFNINILLINLIK